MDSTGSFEIERIQLSDCCCCTWRCTSKLCNLIGITFLVSGILLPTCLQSGQTEQRNHDGSYSESFTHGWWMVVLLWAFGFVCFILGLLINECVVKPRRDADVIRAREEEESEAGGDANEGANVQHLAGLVADRVRVGSALGYRREYLRAARGFSSRQLSEGHRNLMQRLSEAANQAEAANLSRVANQIFNLDQLQGHLQDHSAPPSTSGALWSQTSPQAPLEAPFREAPFRRGANSCGMRHLRLAQRPHPYANARMEVVGEHPRCPVGEHPGCPVGEHSGCSGASPFLTREDAAVQSPHCGSGPSFHPFDHRSSALDDVRGTPVTGGALPPCGGIRSLRRQYARPNALLDSIGQFLAPVTLRCDASMAPSDVSPCRSDTSDHRLRVIPFPSNHVAPASDPVVLAPPPYSEVADSLPVIYEDGRDAEPPPSYDEVIKNDRK